MRFFKKSDWFAAAGGGRCHHPEKGGRGFFGGGRRGAMAAMEGGELDGRMDHPRGGGRGRRGVFDGAELRLVLLQLIADQPRHGYDLIRAVEALSGGGYAPSPGVVYPTLTMLQDMNLVEEIKSDGARKAYAATEEGRAYLTEQAEAASALFGRLADITARHERTDGGPVHRAMSNLKMALRQRLGRADASPEQALAVAAIIDEAVQKIERL